MRRFLLRAHFVALLTLSGPPALAQDFAVKGDEVYVAVTTEFFHPEGGINYTPIQTADVTLFTAEVEGEQVCAIMDTGASNSILGLDNAKRLGLENVQSLGEAKTAGGPVEAYLTRSVRLEIPGQFARVGSLAVAPMPDLTCPDGLKLGLALGRDALSRVSLFVDNPNKRIAFVPPGQLTPKATRHLAIPWIDNRISAEVEGKPVNLYVDTGINAPLVIRESAFDRFISGKERLSAPAANTAGGVVAQTSRVEGVNLKIGKVELTVFAYVQPDFAFEAEIALGNSIFNVNPVIFDAANDVIYLLATDATK